MGITANAYNCMVNKIFYNLDTSAKTASVTYMDLTNLNKGAYSGSVTIPSSFTYSGTTYSVTSIEGRAFAWCSGLTSVVIPNSVTNIGGSLFNNCSSLTSIVVSGGNSVYDSRNNCNAIIETATNTLIAGCKSTTIPNSVTSIKGSAFSYCTGLTSVNIPNSVTSIGEGAFWGCSGLTSLVVESGNSVYDSRNNCNAIIETATNTLIAGCKSTKIPSGVTSIGDYAFFSCTGLTSVNIPNSVTSIGKQAFYYCTGLTSVTIPNGMTSIGYWAFEKCSNLTSVTVEMTTPFTLGSDAFNNISNSCKLYVPANTKSSYLEKGWTTEVFKGGVYEKDTFTYTYDGKTLTYKITNSTSGYLQVGDGTNAAIDTSESGAVNIPNRITYLGQTYTVVGIAPHAFEDCSGLTSVVIPNSVTTIGQSAFQGCSGLTSVTIPNSVNTIYNNAFSGCSGLSSVYINSSDAWLGISFGNMTANPLYYAHRLYMYITLGSGLDDFKFELMNFTIPESVTTIGNYVFSGYSGLLSLTIPSSVTSIGEYAFYGCSGLTSITFPSSLTSIGSNAFNNCSGLSSVTANMVNPFTFGTSAFAGIGSTCSLYVPSGKRDAYINKGWDTSVFKGGVYAGGDLNETFTYTYKGKTLTYKVIDATNRYVQVVKCDKSEIGSVEIPSSITYFDKTFSVTSIGQSAFYDCSGVTSLSIPNSVASIGDGAFYGCSSLTSITIPNSVTTIGDAAFRGCTSLTSITIPKNVINIEGIAFEGCSSLESIVVASGNTIYDSRNNCNAIIKTATNTLILGCKRTTIPSSVTSIGSSAFSRCSGLTSISIPNSVTNIGNMAFADCSGLNSISIPSSVANIENSAFYNCKCSVYCNSETPPSATESTFNKDMRAIVPRNSVSKYKQATGWKKMTIQSIPSLCSLAGTTQTSITLCVSDQMSNVKAVLNEVAYNTQNDSIKITGLEPNTYYTISLSGDYKDLSWNDQISATTKNISLGIQLVKRTNITLTLKGFVSDLGDAEIASSGFSEYEGQNEIYVKGLAPGRTYYYTYYIVTPSGKKLSTTESFQTIPITLNVGATTSSSSAQLTGSYSIIDATITECGFDGYPEQNPIKITGLDPNKSYSQTFYVVTKEGGRGSKSVTYTTRSLTLTTSQPKVISAGNAVVAAESNLDDEETNVGFEWRRIDYTDDFASLKGNAYLYNGTMEGYIRNLYTEKLWKYRPYYTSNAGNSFYGEWVGIDPTNTSYFEPTVHTYANVSVNGNSAEVKGYVQRGTDNVVSKGFAYWEQSQGVKSREAMSAPSMISSLPSNAKTVEISGSQQVMTTTISNLEYETTYCYVAFVRTSEGDTFYGEEMTFTSGESPYILGDVNGDKKIDISDVVAMVNHILGNTPSTSFKVKAADINKDGNIDISDVVALVNMILN